MRAGLHLCRPAVGVCLLCWVLHAAHGDDSAVKPEDDVSTCSTGETDGRVDAGSDDGETKSTGCGCSSLRRDKFGPSSGSSSSPSDSDDTAATAEAANARGGQQGGESEKDAAVIYLKGGTFVMGIVPDDERDGTIFPGDHEGPPRNVTVGPFGLGAHEVSNRRFAAFVKDTGYVTESEKFGWSFGVEAFLSKEVEEKITQKVDAAPWWLPVDKADWQHPNGPDTSIDDIMEHPVTQVSMADALAFCQWSLPGGRLPSEEEWEFAARGGKEQRRFPWGMSMLTGKNRSTHRMNVWQSELDQKLMRDGQVINVYTLPNSLEIARDYYMHGNLGSDGYVQTAPVDAFGPQNAYGFHNMVGNVWEWTSTPWGAAYPEGESPAENMVKKGGSFLCNKAVCNRYRCSARTQVTADSAAANIGFRCAYSVSESNGEGQAA